MQKNLSRHLTKYLFVSLLSKKNTQAQRAIYPLRQLHSHLHCHSSIHGRQANRQAGTLANCHKPEEHRSLVKRRRFVSLARKEKKIGQNPGYATSTREEEGRGGMVQCVGAPCTCAYLLTNHIYYLLAGDGTV